MREPVTPGMLHTDDNRSSTLTCRLSSFTVVTLKEGKLLGSKGQAALVVQPLLMFSLFGSCFIIDSSSLEKVKILSASGAPANLKINPYIMILSTVSPLETNLAHDS